MGRAFEMTKTSFYILCIENIELKDFYDCIDGLY